MVFCASSVLICLFLAHYLLPISNPAVDNLRKKIIILFCPINVSVVIINVFNPGILLTIINARNINFAFFIGENYKTDGYIITDNTMQILKDHLKKTDGQV